MRENQRQDLLKFLTENPNPSDFEIQEYFVPLVEDILGVEDIYNENPFEGTEIEDIWLQYADKFGKLIKEDPKPEKLVQDFFYGLNTDETRYCVRYCGKAMIVVWYVEKNGSYSGIVVVSSGGFWNFNDIGATKRQKEEMAVDESDMFEIIIRSAISMGACFTSENRYLAKRGDFSKYPPVEVADKLMEDTALAVDTSGNYILTRLRI